MRCQQFQKELKLLQKLHSALDHALQGCSESDQLAQAEEALHYARHVKNIFTAQIEKFEQSIEIAELFPDLEERYHEQVEVLRGSILKPLTNGREGIYLSDGREVELPSFAEIARRVLEKKEILLEKSSQGFTEFLLIPFGCSVPQLQEAYAQALRKEMLAGTLYAEYKKFGGKFERRKANLIPGQELQIDSDAYSDVIYFPQNFNKNVGGGGHQKNDLLKNKEAAWQIVFRQPSETAKNETLIEQETVINGRTVLPRKNQTSETYLSYITSGWREYELEHGYTPEAWLTESIFKLHEKDDFGEVFPLDMYPRFPQNLLLGVYNPHFDGVPVASFDTERKDVRIFLAGTKFRQIDLGARTLVYV